MSSRPLSKRPLSDRQPSTREHRADARTDAEALLGLLQTFPDSVVVGFRPADGHVDLHVAPLPPDERTGAAGLFGMRAEDDWSAVGVAIAGRARRLDTRQVVGSTASAAVVVTRAGRRASWMHVDGLPDEERDGEERDGDGLAGLGRMIGGDRNDGGAEGLVVDALHRMLGLPVPGEPPGPGRLAVTIWAHQILEVLLARGTVTWPDALEVHPGEPGPGPVGPSVEMLVEATLRSTEGFRWSDMHARAAGGAITVHELTTAEAAWMDTTMFARWVAGSMPDPSVAIGMLELHDCHAVADSVRRVLHGVEAFEADERCVARE